MNDKAWLLKERQALPLDIKVRMSLDRITEWYNYWKGKAYVSFSGGKDSTVLLYLVRSIFPDIEAVFVDTGLEFPEIWGFVKSIDNVTWLRPKIKFPEVIEKYGYPAISKEVSQQIYEAKTTKSEKLLHKRLCGGDNKYKSGKIPEKWKYLIPCDIKIGHKCCDALKKRPIKKYEKQTGKAPIVGIMAIDSQARKQKYIRRGTCNSFSGKIESNPLSFWTDSDVWEYIRKYDVPYSQIYDMGYDRTGCMFCMFGVHLEKGENRFQRMRRTHPKQWDYCINKLGCGKVLDLIGVDYNSATPLFEKKQKEVKNEEANRAKLATNGV